MKNLKIRRVTLFLTFIILILLSISFTNLVLNKKQSICIDPGHGGFDGGAKTSNYVEKDITLNASLILGDLLEQTGYKVIYTRTKDEALSKEKVNDMKKRLRIINSKNNILYISIHANIFPSKEVFGAQTFYNKENEKSKFLSEQIQSYFKIEQKNNNRLAKAITGKYILDKAEIPGCIVELGFMSNDNDLKYLTNNELLEYRCLMVYLGILKYLEYN